MPNQPTVNWYQEDVIVRVDGASAQSLLAIAFQIEAIAKTKAAVDTGFMRNSGYVVGADINTFVSRADDGYETVSSPEPAPPGGATVGFAANYSIYVEQNQPFLYPAALAVQQDAGGIIESVGREFFGG